MGQIRRFSSGNIRRGTPARIICSVSGHFKQTRSNSVFEEARSCTDGADKKGTDELTGAKRVKIEAFEGIIAPEVDKGGEPGVSNCRKMVNGQQEAVRLFLAVIVRWRGVCSRLLRDAGGDETAATASVSRESWTVFHAA
jgi:hypothetical protein